MSHRVDHLVQRLHRYSSTGYFADRAVLEEELQAAIERGRLEERYAVLDATTALLNQLTRADFHDPRIGGVLLVLADVIRPRFPKGHDCNP